MVRRTLLAALALTLLAASAPARAQTPPPVPQIHVSGEARVTSPPDLAVLVIAVVTQGRDARSAVAENAARTEQVLAALRGALGEDAELETAGVTVHPDYRHPEGGGRPEIVGYTARHAVEARSSALDRVGGAIDAATAGGANEVQSLVFTLRDEEEARTRALRDAVARARRKASAMAEALGARIVRVVLAEESGDGVQPLQRMGRGVEFAQAAADVATPTVPGLVEVRAAVVLHVEIAP
jgi:uncharacterized protein YggE